MTLISTGEREAWRKVVSWFDDILTKKYLNRYDAIGLPSVSIDEGMG